ncbi:MAG: MBL fold hydrolase, partial [Armatimonadetes bacterium CG17_big_fil_post_rev_8_21_14_2_50_66_6]
MGNYRVPEIADGVFAVGVKDWNRRLFDALIPLPEGTTYNAYIVKGSRKTALIDTVDPGFEEELTRRIAEVADPTKLDYVVMNHAEPDHAGSVPHMLALSPEAKLVTSIKGADLAVRKLGVPKGRIEEVVDGNEIDLGGKTLRFLDAPMLHWPETMFTYLPEEAVLFP